MMHERRRFCVGPAVLAEDLAKKLTEQTWTLCTRRLGAVGRASLTRPRRRKCRPAPPLKIVSKRVTIDEAGP